MASLSEVYRNVQNPLDNPQTLDKLFSAYAKSSRHTRQQDIVQGLYRQVIDLNDNKDSSHINRADREQFYVDKYNRWISRMLSVRLSPEKITQLGKVGQEFQEFQQFLQSVGKVNSYSDVINLRTNPSFNFDYDWEIDDFSWEHIQSHHINFGKEKRIDVKHRLYIGCQNQDVWKLLSIFSEKCENGNIPYYFKTPSFEIPRDDKIVIYADSENLAKYIDILNEIARENPEIVSRCGQPPILTGKVNEWIGIGDEPPRDEKGNHSFNEIRALAIDDGIEETLLNSLSSFMGQTVNYQGKNVRFEELFKQYAAKYIASKQASNKNFKNLSQEQLQSIIERQLGGEIAKGLSKLIAIKDTKTSPDINNFDKIFTINIGGQTIGIDIYGMDAITKTMIPVMQQIDPNFRNNAKKAILEKSKQYGIDDTFCFQQGTRQRFETIDINGQAPKQPEIGNANTSQSTVKGQEEITGEQIEDQRITSINSNEIVYRLNPYLLKQMIELPNGAKIPATQYIQEAVAPYIPSNGKIILNNGSEIPATQFIEEYILGEGQQKYKGDIGKLMAENTRANNGTIISRGQKINVVSIVDSLNPTLMGRKVTLPNGAKIPASQYVQEVVAPYIPSNGKFILKNGAEIPATQFIEEAVMFVGQEKYNGDITALLNAMTVANNGTVSVGTDTKPPKGQVKRQEMGGVPKKSEETTERKSNGELEAQSVKKSAKNVRAKERITISDANKVPTRMGEREERKKLNEAKSNGTITPEQQARLNELNRMLFLNPQAMSYKQQGTRKSNGQGMSR